MRIRYLHCVYRSYLYRIFKIFIFSYLELGIYFGKPRGFKIENGEEVGFNTELYAAHEVHSNCFSHQS